MRFPRLFRLLFGLLVVPVLPGMTGCQAQPLKPLDPDSNQSIVKYHEPVVTEDDRNYAFFELYRALLFFELGNFQHADERLREALVVMDRLVGDSGETSGLILDENLKTFKGEPYERATAFFYRGLCRYNMGDYAGALAAFRSSLAADQETLTEVLAETEDYCISSFMAGLCYARLGERDNAVAALKAAGQHQANHTYLDEETIDCNFVAIVPLGSGPYLTSGFAYTKEYACAACPEARVTVSCDGNPIGDVEVLTDLLVQAESHSWGDDDTARVARGAVRSVISAFLGVNVEEKTDVRCWRGLPRRFAVIAADVPSGNHTVGLKFFDAEGQHLEAYDTVWYDVPVSNQAQRVHYLRCKPYHQNVHGLTLRPLSEAMQANE